MKRIGFSLVGACLVGGCAATTGGMLEQDALEIFQSDQTAGEVAGCVQQGLRSGPTMGTDGINFWVTRENALGTVVRYDFKPNPTGSGSIVEYRSRLRINNGLDVVQGCL